MGGWRDGWGIEGLVANGWMEGWVGNREMRGNGGWRE